MLQPLRPLPANTKNNPLATRREPKATHWCKYESFYREASSDRHRFALKVRGIYDTTEYTKYKTYALERK